MAFIGFCRWRSDDCFVTLGVILANRLKLDPIIALGMTFLPLYMAFSVSPSGMAKIGQIVYPEVTLYSGYGGRAIMYTVFYWSLYYMLSGMREGLLNHQIKV